MRDGFERQFDVRREELLTVDSLNNDDDCVIMLSAQHMLPCTRPHRIAMARMITRRTQWGLLRAGQVLVIGVRI